MDTCYQYVTECVLPHDSSDAIVIGSDNRDLGLCLLIYIWFFFYHGADFTIDLVTLNRVIHTFRIL